MKFHFLKSDFRVSIEIVSAFLIVGTIFTYNSYSSAESTSRVGNGADAVVCRNTNGDILPPSRLFDFWEGERNGLPSNLDGKTAKENTDILINRLKKFSPRRSEIYKEFSDKFFYMVNEVRGDKLPDIPDSNAVRLPDGCDVEQLIIYRPPIFDGDKPMEVQMDIWDTLPVADQAAAKIHEIAFWETRRLGESDSVTARRFVALLSSEEIEKKSFKEFVRFLEQGNLGSFEYSGILFNSQKDYKFDDSGHLVNATTDRTSHLKFDDLKGFESRYYNLFAGIEVELLSARKVEFYTNGVPKRLIFNEQDLPIEIEGFRILGRDTIVDSLNFHQNGQVKDVYLTSQSTSKSYDSYSKYYAEIQRQGKTIELGCRDYSPSFSFWPNGKYRSGCFTVRNEVTLNVAGVDLQLQNQKPRFHSNGAIKFITPKSDQAFSTGRFKVKLSQEHQARFDENGLLRAGRLANSYRFPVKTGFIVTPKLAGAVFSKTNGNILAAATKGISHIELDGKLRQVMGYDRMGIISFYEDQSLNSGFLLYPYKGKDTKGHPKRIAGSNIFLNRAGEIVTDREEKRNKLSKWFCLLPGDAIAYNRCVAEIESP